MIFRVIALPLFFGLRTALVVALVVALTLLIAIAQPAVAEPESLKPAPLKIGGLYGLTGPLIEFSASYRNGALLAAERSDEDFPVPLQLVVEDHRWDSKLALSAYKKLSNVDGVRIFQVMGSSPSIVLKPLTEANGHLMISAAAYIAGLKNARGVIRHANRTEDDAQSLADYIRKQGWKTIGGIAIENEWSNDYDAKFKEELEKSGIRYHREYHAPDASDFRSHATRVISRKPDAIVFVSFGLPCGLAMKALRDLRYSGPIIGNNGFALSHDARRLVAEADLKDIYMQDYAPPPPEFEKLYRARFGEPAHAVSYWSYADMEVISAVAQQVGPEPMTIARHIKQLGNFKGRFGTLEISPDGDVIERTQIVPFAQ